MADKFDALQQLREATGAGVMECKRVLEEAGGDFDKAVALIRERGLAKVEKRAERATGAGLVETYVHNGRIGVMLELRAETDFVVRSEPFQDLAKALVMHIAAMRPETVEELLAQPFVRDESRTVNDMLTDLIARTGENAAIARFARFEV